MQRIVINQCYGGYGISDLAFEELLKRKGIEFTRVTDEGTIIPVHFFDTQGNELWPEDFIYHRTDPDLIALVESMGDSVNSRYSQLGIVEVPDDVRWHIAEYDGLEHVAEDHRKWG